MNFLNQFQIEILRNITLEAGKIAMSYFGNENLIVKRKGDNSKVTVADQEVSDFIEKNLKINFPDIEIVCEEGENREATKAQFWLIDPIDGTNSFVENNAEFTINIALIKNNIPVFGIIYAPAIKGSPLYYTDENNQIIKYLFGEKQKLITENNFSKKNKFNIITSKTINDLNIGEYLQNNFKDFDQNNFVIIKMASSFKFCKLIEGEADLYLHFRKSMEWDIAAGHALLLAAGGSIINLDETKLSYNKKDFLNKSFVARMF